MCHISAILAMQYQILKVYFWVKYDIVQIKLKINQLVTPYLDHNEKRVFQKSEIHTFSAELSFYSYESRFYSLYKTVLHQYFFIILFSLSLVSIVLSHALETLLLQ